MLTAPRIRRQLTLFAPVDVSLVLNRLREKLDPIQAALISAHVTLCREDEIAGISLADLQQRIALWRGGAVSLSFGPPQRFSGDGRHGIFLPCVAGCAQYQLLRECLVRDGSARRPEPHLTLAHPRNPIAEGNTDAAMAGCPSNLHVTFVSVALIEQRDGMPWEILGDVSLIDAMR